MKWLQRNAKTNPNSNDSVTEKISKIRGIKDTELFLNPTEEVLNDPYLMKNIQDASNKIIQAIGENKKIVVSYDPDADGLASATIMIRYLKNYTDNVDFIYGERNDGHGIEEMITVKKLHAVKQADRIEHNKRNTDLIKEADLLIIVDSSSNDVQACKHIREVLKTDIVILDHHEIEVENPYALMVNPQQEGCKYPNKFLSGAGVVFKTLQVMEDTLDSVDVWQYIDLVAVGMYADMMRVDILENRYLIMHGLRNMKNTGLIRILKGAKADFFRLNGDSIGFGIAPLLNGVARMGNIKLAIDILLEDDDKICKKLRLKMQKLNEERKEKQKEIVERYKSLVDDSKKVIVVMDDNSSRGFNGLVSQQLTDLYNRPAIVGRLHKGKLSGSFRSYGGFDFKQFLNDSALIEEAMGHSQAGGIDVLEENIEPLMAYIENNLPKLEEEEPFILYDLDLDVSEAVEQIRDIEKFNLVTGNGFPKVLAKVNNITVNEVACIGQTQETVKISTLDDLELIKFKVNDQYASELDCFDTINVVGELAVNEFFNHGIKQRVITPQVRLQDYAIAE